MSRWLRIAKKDDALENFIDSKTRRNFLNKLIDDEIKRNDGNGVSLKFILDILFQGWLTRNESEMFNKVISDILPSITAIDTLKLLEEEIIVKEDKDFYKLAIENLLSKTDKENPYFFTREAFKYFLDSLELFNKNDNVYKLMQKSLIDSEDCNNLYTAIKNNIISREDSDLFEKAIRIIENKGADFYLTKLLKEGFITSDDIREESNND